LTRPRTAAKIACSFQRLNGFMSSHNEFGELIHEWKKHAPPKHAPPS
jgi:hypothetical protein